MEVNMEYFDVVDKNRVQLNYKKIRGEKLEKNEFNTGVEMWIINNNKILMTQRSEQKSHPGQWETPGGCSQAGESIIDTIKREMIEEIGVNFNQDEFCLIGAHLYKNRGGESRPQKQNRMNQIAYKFVSWDVPALESLAGSKAYILRKRLNDGGTLTREEKDWITREVNHNTYFKDSIPLLGYRFNFVDVLKTFVVKQYGHYTEYKGVDKTSIRSMLYGRVERIVEL